MSDGLADSLVAVEACLADAIDRIAGASPLHAAMADALLSPGKRLRPLLALAAHAQAGGAQPTPAPVVAIACAFELMHAASLIYDDLPCMDDAADRRGAPALHVAHGQATALLAAIALMNGAYRLAADAGSDAAIVRLLADTVGAAGLAAGQWHDLNPGGAAPAEMRRLKTGLLFRAAAEAGARCADADGETLARLAQLADTLGGAFQLLDDLDDHDAPEDEARLRADLSRQLAAARASLGTDRRAAPLRAWLDLVFGAA